MLITLSTGDPNIGPSGNGIETLDASLVSSTKALLIEFDSFASASGELDLQATTLSTPSGGYTFSMTGDDRGGHPISIGGVFNIDSADGISGRGSIFDLNADGTLFTSQSFAASTVTTPDPLGRMTFTLNPSVVTSGINGLVVDGYMVDVNHIRLLEGGIPIAGTALGQTGTGTFSPNSISGSTYVIATAGEDIAALGTVLQVAGVLTFNADGSVSGRVSGNIGSRGLLTQNPPGGVALAAEVLTAPCSSGMAVTPCYTVDAPGIGTDGGTGRVTVTNVTDGATFNYNLELYLTGDGHAVVISIDHEDISVGLGFQQATSTFNASSFSGTYALNLGTIPIASFVNVLEMDGVGTVAADGLGTATGFLDINETRKSNGNGTLVPDSAVSATFAVGPANGVFTGVVNGNPFTFYLVNTTQIVGIENDFNQFSLAFLELQQ